MVIRLFIDLGELVKVAQKWDDRKRCGWMGEDV
jgi:hypothetical protein